MKTNKKQIAITKVPTYGGSPKEMFYPENSNAVHKFEARKRDKVLHSGGTRVGSFK